MVIHAARGEAPGPTPVPPDPPPQADADLCGLLDSSAPPAPSSAPDSADPHGPPDPSARPSGGSDSHSGAAAGSLGARLTMIVEHIQGMLADEAWPLSDGELDALLEGVGRLGGPVAAVNNRLITEALDRGLAPRRGASDIPSLLRDRLALSTREARRQVALARAVSDGPCEATGQALACGDITVEHAHVIREAIASLPIDITPQERADAEQTLLGHARVFDPYRLVRLAARIREDLTRVDPSPGADSRTGQSGDSPHDDSDDPGRGPGDRDSDADTPGSEDRGSGEDSGSGRSEGGDEDQRPSPDPAAVRRLSLRDTPEGTTLISGELDAEAAALLRTALDGLAAPRPAVDGIPDIRSPQRRRADALVELVTRALTGAVVPVSGGVRPHLVVHVPWDTLVRGGLEPAMTDWGLPLPRGVLTRLACDAEVSRIILDPAGVPLDVGRSTRVVPSSLRRALVVRDRGCAYPGCDVPPSWTECHHITPWQHGGRTMPRNLVLLCGAHHRQVHHDRWRILVEDDDRPSFIPPPHIDPRQRPRRNPYG
ncbi:HNH endonuclease signature motif containing protein, partial [Frankia canadensis]|uniref:HNH endonuclease signature motif containing protein n=1 Tax=Frankia canadensis TaxID=1836972 RepID=UPI000C7D50B7